MDHPSPQPSGAWDDEDTPLTSITADRRPAGSQPSPAPRSLCLALPAWPWGDATAPVPFAAALIAALLVLLARHAGQPRAMLALLREGVAPGEPSSQPLSISLAEDPRFDAVEADVARALTAWPGPGAPGQGRPGPAVAVRCAQTEIGLRVPGLSPATGSSPYELTFTLEAGSRLRVDFDPRLYRDSTFERLGRQLRTLLVQAADAPGQPVSRLSLLNAAERRQLIALSHGERRRYPVDRTMAQLFEAQARRRPAALAIEGGGEALTYAQVDAMSRRMAALIERITPAGSRVVPVVHARHPRFLVAVLAVMRCGRAFLPVDPGHPPERVRCMVQQVGARTLVAEAAVLDELTLVLGDSGIGAVVLTDAAPPGPPPAWGGPALHGSQVWMAGPLPAALPPGSPRDPAYIIFTSGSTGQPKGVISRHDGAVNHMFAEIEALALDDDTRFLQAARLTTDLCIWQFLAPGAIGATCVVAADEDVADPRRLHERLVQERITIVELVPMLLRTLADHLAALDPAQRALPALRWMMVSGEPLPVALANLWLAMFPHIPVVNAYGPTEVSDDSTQYIVRRPLPETSLGVPIGRPLPNLQVLILDAAGDLVPVGVPGELHVAGIGVGDGYWGDLERTRAAFIANRWSGPPYATLYRTGDRGRWLEDGQIELAGRLDDQVKIRGHRIELREVESVLARHPAVSHCVAVVREDVPGRRRLVAYVVATLPVTPAELRAHLAPRLPDCMVPTAWVFMDRLPMTANGVKVSRRALPPPDVPVTEGDAAGGAPRSPLQAALASLWTQVLGHPVISLDDDFFELGGDSVHTVELAVLARAAGIELPPGAVFEHPTIARLARAIEAGGQSGGREVAPAPGPGEARPWNIAAAERGALEARLGPLDDVYPLAPTQRGILAALIVGASGRGTYVEQVTGVLREPGFEPALFEQAWAGVAQRHPALRSVVVRQGLARPVQAVCRVAAVRFEVQDLRGTPEAGDAEGLAARSRALALQRLPLDRSPLLRVVLSRLTDEEAHFSWTYPHILLDGWSEAVVLEQVFQAYRALRAGAEPPQPQPATPFVEYVAWAARADATESRAFWTQLLAGLPPTAVWPVRRPGPACAGAPAPGGFTDCECRLPASLTEGLGTLARRRGWTLGTLLQGAWALVQAAHSGRHDVVFGVAASGRQGAMPGIDSVVGLVAGVVPMRVQVAPAQAADAWLDGVQRAQFSSRRHENLPLDAMRERGSGAAALGPLFATCFVLANYPAGGLDRADGGLQVRALDFHTRPDFPLTICLRPGSQLLLRCRADQRFLAAAELQGLMDGYAAVLAALRTDAAQPVAALLQRARQSRGPAARQASAARTSAMVRASA